LSVYYEVTTNTGIDFFIKPIIIFFLIILVLKYRVLSEIVADFTKQKRSTLVRIFTTVMALWLVSFTFSYSSQIELRNLIENKEYKIVDGCVSEYRVEIPKYGTKVESFKVNGVYFEFSNYDDNLYFNGKDHLDSFLKNGQCLSIDYIQKNKTNRIVKISS
jgi:heme/copper-type cytochrome/quinol oxidase subunit 2